MRNIKMTMPKMQLNSKFMNNMLPEWSRFITEVKLNKGLKESNFDQLYAYLKQHEVHANESRMMMERFIQPTNDPLALVSNESNQKYPTQSSESPQSSNRPSIADNVQDRKYDSDCEDRYHEVHKMQSDVQHNYVVDSDADYTSDSNIILYDQYVEDNEEHVVQSNVSSVRNDALMSCLDEMHEQGVQSMSVNKQDKVVNDSVTSELARYKELVGVYEQWAKFELTDRERKIDEQMIIIISDQNRKETSLKSKLHSA
ncbi:hypothetical protein Tco_0055006 [Tanacetum coccineum]